MHNIPTGVSIKCKDNSCKFGFYEQFIGTE